MLVELLVLSLAIAAASYTLTRGFIFKSIRRMIARRSMWLGKLVNCPYCVSHWLAAASVVLYHPRPVHGWLPADLLVSGFALVCLSAFFLGLIALAFPEKREIPEIEPPLPPPSTDGKL